MVARRPSPTRARSPPPSTKDKPPRPPNAWILYRSDKLKQMPTQPGQPRRAQADVSKDISQMWKSESPEVRAHYEQLAELRKAEHAVAYPGYRFQPVKRAEKERIREERRQERERERQESRKSARHRAAPYPTGPVPPQHTPYYNAASQYSPYGPSPPISQASTPSMTPSPLSLPSEHPIEFVCTTFPSTSTQPATDAIRAKSPPASRQASGSGASASASIPTPAPTEGLQTPLERWTAQLPPELDPSLSQPTNAFSQESSSSSMWPMGLDQSQDMTGTQSTSDLLTFDIPEMSWGESFDSSGMSLDTMQQPMMMATGDPHTWELAACDTSLLLDSLDGIQLSLGQSGSNTNTSDELLFHKFAELLEQQNTVGPQAFNIGGDFFDGAHDPTQYFNFPEDDLPLMQSQELPTSQQTLPTSDMDFTGFDFASFASSTVHPSQLALPTLVPSAASSSSSATPSPPTEHTLYVPPSGAGNTAARRVGGSWKPPAALMQSPAMTPAALQQWSVPSS